jgi:acetylornithine deacetylase/succinyl-diaminopimelate desuccinylase-like protein
MAGSGPMYLFARTLGIPVASGAGVGHDGSNVHAPNENVEVNDYLQAIKYYGEMMRLFAQS